MTENEKGPKQLTAKQILDRVNRYKVKFDVDVPDSDIKKGDVLEFVEREARKLVKDGKAKFYDAEKQEEFEAHDTANILTNTNDFFNGSEFISKRVGDIILIDTRIKTLKGSDEIYRYDNGFYVNDGKEIIREECKKLLGERYNTRRTLEVINYIQTSTYTDPNEINNGWLNLSNGLYNPETDEFKNHTPDIFSTVRIEIEYDPKAECPLFLEKLEGKADARTITVLQEMFGYCLLDSQKYEIALLLYGPPRTMKSTVLYVLCQLLGSTNTTAFQLSQLNEDAFAMSYLYGKLANICPDLTKQALKSTGAFMALTGTDQITYARKHSHPVTWFPMTKLIFSCNQIPRTSNRSDAYYRRWIILQFETQTPKDEIDPNLKPKLVKELSGILNWAILGLKRLEENKKTSFWLDEHGVRDVYERNSDTISSFIMNKIDTEDDVGIVKKRLVYRAYIEYCQENGITHEMPSTFGKVFVNHTGCGSCKQDGIPAYRGISLVDFDNKGAEKDRSLEDFKGE